MPRVIARVFVSREKLLLLGVVLMLYGRGMPRPIGKPIFFGEGEITSALGRGMPRPYNTCDR